MAAFTGRTLLLLLLTLTVVLTFSPCMVSISPRDYDSITRVLRSHGYNLICNAMATSDLQYQLLTRPPNTSFTIFAPTDASLFALDMIQTTSSYTDTLRLHAVPFRLSFFELRSISNGSILPTLLPSTALLLSTNDPLAVSGVEVVLPGLYYYSRLAVHKPDSNGYTSSSIPISHLPSHSSSSSSSPTISPNPPTPKSLSSTTPTRTRTHTQIPTSPTSSSTQQHSRDLKDGGDASGFEAREFLAVQ